MQNDLELANIQLLESIRICGPNKSNVEHIIGIKFRMSDIIFLKVWKKHYLLDGIM